MIVIAALGLAGLTLAYLGLSLQGLEGLRPLLRIRGPLATFLVLLLVLGAAQKPTGGAFLFVLIGMAAAGYSAVRQWLVPNPAPLLEPIEANLEPSEIVAVTASGAVPVRLLERLRTVRVHGSLIVHCRLANSTAAFAHPPGAPVAALLPLTAGFEIGGPAAALAAVGPRWDGIDGSLLAGRAEPLTIQPVALATAADWRTDRPDEPVLGVKGMELPPRQGPPQLLVPAAAGVADPLQLGRVTDEGWAPAEPDGVPGRWLGRWAARARGIPGA